MGTATENILDNIVQNILSMKGKHNDIKAVGISLPGVIDSQNSLTTRPITNIPGLNKIDLKKVIFEKTGLETFLMNDANSATLYEFANGSLKDVNTGLLITIGTGIGVGLIVNKDSYEGGESFSAGEIGKMIINYLPWELIASTRTIVNEANQICGKENYTG